MDPAHHRPSQHTGERARNRGTRSVFQCGHIGNLTALSDNGAHSHWAALPRRKLGQTCLRWDAQAPWGSRKRWMPNLWMHTLCCFSRTYPAQMGHRNLAHGLHPVQRNRTPLQDDPGSNLGPFRKVDWPPGRRSWGSIVRAGSIGKRR